MMNSWQWIQVLGATVISVAAVTELRAQLIKRTNFIMFWSILSAVAMGLCAGVIVDAVNLPGKYEIFGAVTLFVIMVYTTTGDDERLYSSGLSQAPSGDEQRKTQWTEYLVTSSWEIPQTLSDSPSQWSRFKGRWI